MCRYTAFMISLSIPNFTEGPLGIVIKSVGKENFHSSHIVYVLQKCYLKKAPPPPQDLFL
jgi:hypothetical protein